MAQQILIVGAGPIGLETAAALREVGQTVTVVDAGPVGATMYRAFPPHTRFFTSPERLELDGLAVPSVHQEKLTGEEYLAYLRSFVTSRGLDVRTFHSVRAAVPQGGRWSVSCRTPSGAETTLTADAVVLASGGTDHPRRLGVPGEDLPHVHTYPGDPHRYFGRTVLVVGGRNSAVETALRCYRVGATVHLCHRGPEIHPRVKYWIRPEVVELIAEGRIQGHFQCHPVEITPAHVRLRGPEGDFEVPVDDVIPQIGFEQDKSLFRLFGVPLAGPQRAPQHDPETMRTPVPGVFVAGTATAGTQDRFGVFIENCHIHARRIAAAVTGALPPPDSGTRADLEV